MQPATDTTLAGVALGGSQIESFSYVGSDQRLYQLIRQDSSWQAIDVFSFWQSTTGITLPFPRPGAGARGDAGRSPMFWRWRLATLSAPVACAALPGCHLPLHYIDQNSHVQALPYPLVVGTEGLPKGATIASAWNPDLTERTGAPPAAADSRRQRYRLLRLDDARFATCGLCQRTDGNVCRSSIPGPPSRTTRGSRRTVVAGERNLSRSHRLYRRTGAQEETGRSPRPCSSAKTPSISSISPATTPFANCISITIPGAATI